VSVSINEIWYVPVFGRGRRRPLIYYKHMATTRKVAIENIIMESYRGAHDWKYRKELGWTIERVTISNGDRESKRTRQRKQPGSSASAN
jgi:hypothetical protein